MKTILLLILFPCLSQAQQQGVQVVHEVATSTNTITQTISLCTSGGVTDVATATSTGTVSGSFGVEVYNPSSSTSTIVCGFDVSLSSQIYSVWYGREVAAGVGILWQKLSNRKLYCETLNSGGCTQTTITQVK